MSDPTGLLLARDGDFPDVEAVVMDLLSAVEVDGQQVGDRTGTRTPVEVDGLYIHVFRAAAAGGMNTQAWSDTANLYVAAWSPTRAQSRQMISGVRALVALFVDGGAHRGILIDRMWESSAPGPLPLTDEDDRRTEMGVTVRMRRYHGPDVYA